MLTDTFIRSAKPGIHWDGSLKGFGLRVGKERKTFIVLVASGRRKSIGTWPLVSLADARKEARRILAEKQLGKVRPTHTALEDAVRDFLAECEARNRPRTVADYRRHLKVHFPFGRQAVADVTPRQLAQRLRALDDRPAEKHHAYTAARRFFNWAHRQHLIDVSPMARMETPPLSRPRERVLTEDELRPVWNTARRGETTFHRIVALLILTGARRSEIASIRWEWIEEDYIEWPPEATKNGRRHRVPIGEIAQGILSSTPRIEGCPYVFPAARKRSEKTTVHNSWGKPKAAFDKECGVKNWTLHDLRRTYASGMQRLGVRLEVTEALLNHVSGTQSGIVGVYHRYGWEKEKREAVLKWEAHLDSLT